ncbi:MAG: YeeE/YedE family protein [Candidatus Kapabacteria bacterium]|jgi:hypothetical protein|nr:YeeE/YedE family protein [Candidatus Kapabacteria bacterium]
MILLRGFLVGIAFGMLLIGSEVASWSRIQDMFAFADARMYLILGSAIATGALGYRILLRSTTTAKTGDSPYRVPPKELTKGTIIGGLIFGAAWAVVGTCPGPIYALVGAGLWPALAIFAGAIVGTGLYARLRPILPH